MEILDDLGEEFDNKEYSTEINTNEENALENNNMVLYD